MATGSTKPDGGETDSQQPAATAFDPAAELTRLQRVAAQYATSAASPTELQAVHFLAHRTIDRVVGPEVLVMGAATGVWIEPLLERFGTFDIVDAVDAVLEPIRQRHGERVRTHCALFERFAPPRPYDTIVLDHVLEHVLDPVLVLRRARSWLREGGRCLVLVPNARSLHRTIGVRLGILPRETALGEADRRIGHRRVYDADALRADIEAAGLACDLIDGLLLKPLSNAQMDRWDDALRQAFFEIGDELPERACVILCVATRPPAADR